MSGRKGTVALRIRSSAVKRSSYVQNNLAEPSLVGVCIHEASVDCRLTLNVGGGGGRSPACIWSRFSCQILELFCLVRVAEAQ